MLGRATRRFATLFVGLAVVFGGLGIGIGALGGEGVGPSLIGGFLAGGCLLIFVALFSAVGGPGRARPFARGAPAAGVGGYLLTDEVPRRDIGDLAVSLAAGVGLVLLALAVTELL